MCVARNLATHFDIHPPLLVIVTQSKVVLPPPNQVPIPVITASVLTVAMCPEVHSVAGRSHTLKLYMHTLHT